jgi:hypothetical protein
MAKEKITTSILLQRLFKTTNISRFITRHDDQLLKEEPFHVYITQLCKTKKAVPERILIKAGLDQKYGHQYFNGKRKPVQRDTVVQLAFGFGLDFDETQALLRAARHSTLYAKVERDAAIIYALEKKLPIAEVNDMLYDLKLPLLGNEDKYK